MDGFPRNQDNVAGWNEVMGQSVAVHGVIYIKCSEETMTNRILKRGLDSGRTDDNLEVLKKRFKTYENETFPLIPQFKERGTPVLEVDGEQKADEVYSNFIAEYKALIAPTV